MSSLSLLYDELNINKKNKRSVMSRIYMVGILYRVENIYHRRCDASVENKK